MANPLIFEIGTPCILAAALAVFARIELRKVHAKLDALCSRPLSDKGANVYTKVK